MTIPRLLRQSLKPTSIRSNFSKPHRLYGSTDPRLAEIRVLLIHRYRNYLIFYRHIGERVEVLHIWHGARDIATLLSDLD